MVVNVMLLICVTDVGLWLPSPSEGSGEEALLLVARGTTPLSQPAPLPTTARAFCRTLWRFNVRRCIQITCDTPFVLLHLVLDVSLFM